MHELINLTEWTDEPPMVKLHAITAVIGFFVGGYVLYARKGTPLHKALGRLFAGLALVAILSSFFIHEIRLWGRWSPIHLLSLYALWMLVRGVMKVRAGDIHGHQDTMRWLFVSGFIVAGAFTFLPGRTTYEVLLEQGLLRLTGNENTAETLVLAIPVAAVWLALWIMVTNRRKAS